MSEIKFIESSNPPTDNLIRFAALHNTHFGVLIKTSYAIWEINIAAQKREKLKIYGNLIIIPYFTLSISPSGRFQSTTRCSWNFFVLALVLSTPWIFINDSSKPFFSLIGRNTVIHYLVIALLFRCCWKLMKRLYVKKRWEFSSLQNKSESRRPSIQPQMRQRKWCNFISTKISSLLFFLLSLVCILFCVACSTVPKSDDEHPHNNSASP